METTNGVSFQRSLKTIDDVTSLTSFNPFSEEDEHDQSSYAIVTSLFSKVKNTLAAPLSSAVTSSNHTASPLNPPPAKDSTSPVNQPPRPQPERPNSLDIVPSNPAPPLVFLTPVVSEAPSYNAEYDRPSSRSGAFNSPTESNHDGVYGTAIPGFPIADDARSIRTSGSTNLRRTASASKVIRRIRGEGLSRDYWMDDKNAKECYDCKSVFTTWRRKHHCRICGQIFCSRCASNIIKGSRFGHDGMVRVCNLCLEKLEKGGEDNDDDDDHRSIISSLTSHAIVPPSPFAASQLFYRTDEPYSLFSIAETRRQVSDDGSGSSRSRPLTPGEWDSPAPFRRNLADEEPERQRDVLDLDAPAQDTLTTGVDSQSTIQFPTGDTVGQSTIQFPRSISIEGSSFSADTPRPMSMRTSRVNSFAETEIAAPFLRSRVQSRLEWSGGPEPGWRTRRESTAYAQEINAISMFHLRVMLRQMLTKESVPNVKEWEETLLKLALQIARDLTFNSLSTSMDVRQHVKIKKIPGGAPRDSEYVDGAVITKNVAHKQMARSVRNPRVMLVTFPFEFHRVEGQYMHLDPLVNQEKQYLTNLVGRVAALRPHVVLVEKSVSRIALEALLEHNIAVARTVKSSAIQLVARMSQADVFSSMDKLAYEPRLGHCTRYRLQTFDHALIPGRRKTYMRFEGCSRDMGCTIILRGGDLTTLKRIKNVVRFLAFVVRHLKMETHLWKDSVITLPPVTADAVPAPLAQLTSPIRPRALSTPTLMNVGLFSPSQQRWTAPAMAEVDSLTAVNTSESTLSDDEDLPHDDAAQLRLSRRIQQSVEPYLKTFISVSATLRFPPPYPIRRMKELDDLLQDLRCAWEDEVILKEEKGSHHDRDATLKVDTDLTLPTTPELPKTPTPGDIGTIRIEDPRQSYFDQVSNVPADDGLVSVRDSIASIFVPPIDGADVDAQPEVEITVVDKPIVLKEVADISKESALSLAKFQHDEHRPVWEWYLRKNADDFVIEHYQTLAVRECITTIDHLEHCKPCHMPQITYFNFYGENDCTLGHYIERSITEGIANSLDTKTPCSGCDRPLAAHCKIYVHNESRLLAAVEPWSGKIQAKTSDAPVYDMITTWSVCRRCGQATPFIPVSEETLRYSWAKFLELHFYPADVLIVPGAGCSHNIYLDHARYFAYKGMTVRFQADPIVLQEIVFPPRRIRVRPETLLELKNGDYQRMLDRSATWFAALIHDLKLLLVELGDTDADSSIRASAYIREADGHRHQMARDIHRIYDESQPTDTLALGQARQRLQDIMVDWQGKLDTLPRPRLSQLTEKEPRRPSTFGSVRQMWHSRRNESSSTLDRLPSSNISEVEGEYLRRIGTASSLTHGPQSQPQSDSEDKAKTAEKGLSLVPPQSPSLGSESSVSQGSPRSSPRSPSFTKPQRSDPDSDSTIGARRMLTQTQVPTTTQPSKLPRRPGARVSVAELVKRYQEGPPSHHKTLSGSGQEDISSPRVRRTRSRKPPGKQPLLSDFEQSYAANIAPKYLTHINRRQAPNLPNLSRIPCPVPSGLSDSRMQSRQTSPEKRLRTNATPSKQPTASADGLGRTGKRATSRTAPRDRLPARPTTSTYGKASFRRSVSTAGNKVSNITRHFERISKDSERTNRRYAVIRGRRARPVASGRPKVQVFDSIQDVMRNETESSDSSSDADDEGDEDEDAQVPTFAPPPKPELALQTETQPTPEPVPVEPKINISPEAEESGHQDPEPSTTVTRRRPPSITPSTNSWSQSPMASIPPSPGLPTLPVNSPALTPPEGWGPTIQERHSFMKAISGLWSQQLPVTMLKSLADSYEDISTDPVHIHRDSPIALRTDEPTSIIAVALRFVFCKDYRERQKAARMARRKTKMVAESVEVFMPDDRSTAESTSSWGMVDMDHLDDEGDAAQFLKQSSGSEHVWSFDFPFDDVIITCVTMFPEQFHALRRICECEKSIVESLARCVKWNASGGKSGSAFLKTRDDRFIAKELSKAELTAMATFAPAYFEYMASTISAGRPTLLAKIFGCFRISFTKPKDAKTTAKSRTSGTVFLVMENLFYDRRFTNIYDLKGSTRNRHVHATGRENEVLLDENLVQSAHINPLYLREHSKRILRGALWNDSRFLADLNVMDYSLVVGVDSVKNELVMGIVDYIRTYTWDKKLESWVKDASFLGGGAHKGEPTIVTPKQYKARFRSAMERYFPLVPDRWMKQPDQPNEDGDSLLNLWPDS
ncbi:hypothetical protein K439DRAFT_1566358 [Ramaria rubella]|nr:hypothetical protein K439DRAFT_1566358 [Ramaria rubella]